MDVGTDSTQGENHGESAISDANIQGEQNKTEPININRGRRRPSGNSCTDQEKVMNTMFWNIRGKTLNCVNQGRAISKYVQFTFVSIKGPGGSAPNAYPYATKRSRSLDKRGSKSFDSTNDGKESVASRRMSTIGSISGASGCNAGNPEKITQNSNNISFEEST